MPKTPRPPSSARLKVLQIRQNRRAVLEKLWTLLVILGFAGLIGYNIIIQILHHP